MLITGGSGFFGQHLVRGLLSKNYRIRVLDIEDFRDREIEKNIEFIKGDVRDKERVEASCKDIDYVFHNVALLPVSRSKKNIFWEVDVTGTKNILNASLTNKVKKVVFTSSSAPYGIPKESPITEKTEFNPVCDYGRSKIEAEQICNKYRKRDLNIIVLRPRTIIGKGRLGLFQILYSWIADNKNIYIIGKGDNLCQLLGERDLVDACIFSIEKPCQNEDFNLGTDRFRTVREDLQGLIDHAKSASKIIPLPPKPTKAVLRTLDMLNLVPFTSWHYLTSDKPFYFDISKAKRILGWQPKVSNLDMLKGSYDWYVSNRETIDSDFGTTHTKSPRQRILRILKKLS